MWPIKTQTAAWATADPKVGATHCFLVIITHFAHIPFETFVHKLNTNYYINLKTPWF